MSAAWTMPRDMSGYSTLEAAMLAAIHAAGLPAPVAEYPFDKCCPHQQARHSKHGTGCDGCWEVDEPVEVALHEYRKGRAWRLDFAWPALMVAVECEGGTFSGGRHTRGAGFAADAEKYAHATLAGWAVLRVTGEQIEDGRALEWLEKAIAQRQDA